MPFSARSSLAAWRCLGKRRDLCAVHIRVLRAPLRRLPGLNEASFDRWVSIREDPPFGTTSHITQCGHLAYRLLLPSKLAEDSHEVAVGRSKIPVLLECLPQVCLGFLKVLPCDVSILR